MIRKSWVIAAVGLNFAGGGGVGKNARNTRSHSRVTKFFVANWTGGGGEALHACLVAPDEPAASEGAMVEEGGSVIDPRRLHVEKPTRGKMTFYFAEYQN